MVDSSRKASGRSFPEAVWIGSRLGGPLKRIIGSNTGGSSAGTHLSLHSDVATSLDNLKEQVRVCQGADIIAIVLGRKHIYCHVV